MKWPWKKIGEGIKKGIAVGALLGVPGLAVADKLIDTIEDKLPDSPGTHKKETVEAVTDAVLESSFSKLTPEELVEAKAIRSEYIDLGVTVRDSTARMVELAERFKSLVKD